MSTVSWVWPYGRSEGQTRLTTVLLVSLTDRFSGFILELIDWKILNYSLEYFHLCSFELSIFNKIKNFEDLLRLSNSIRIASLQRVFECFPILSEYNLKWLSKVARRFIKKPRLAVVL